MKKENKVIRIITIAALVLAVGISFAQTPQPYAGLQHRPIKALSDLQLADLRAGRGMSLALSAELNGYPGPLHVIELAGELGLTPDQRARMQRLYDAMKAEAIPLGEQLIAREAELDHLFARRIITPTTLAAATSKIGQTQARLRAAHLRYHLLAAELLTPDQVQRYSELRGYSGMQDKILHPGSHHQ